MRPALNTVVAISCLAGAAFSQTAFEVASIKPSGDHSGAPVTVYPGGRVVIHSQSLKGLVTMAFDAGYWQISGGEDWVAKEVYDIEAKPAANPQPDAFNLRHTRFGIEDEHIRQMLQTLLIERFHLKLRRETNTGPIYLLEKTGKTLLLKPTQYSIDHPAIGEPGFSGEVEYTGGHWFLFNTSMPQLARFASDYVLHKAVIDQTGLDGLFDYRDADAKIQQEMDFEGTFPIFIQTVGLKLTSSKGPVEMFVIEHAEKPSPN